MKTYHNKEDKGKQKQGRDIRNGTDKMGYPFQQIEPHHEDQDTEPRCKP
jgi:hypothetical protein